MIPPVSQYDRADRGTGVHKPAVSSLIVALARGGGRVNSQYHSQ